MNLKTLQKFRPLLITTSLFVIIVAIIAVISVVSIKKRAQPKPIPSPTPVAPNIIARPTVNPESLPPDIKKIREKIIASAIKDNRGDLLLYQTDSYEIEFIKTPNIFFATIYQDPAEEVKKDIETWFLKFGLKQKDLCDLSLRFVLGNMAVRQTSPNFSSLPNGCTTQ